MSDSLNMANSAPNLVLISEGLKANESRIELVESGKKVMRENGNFYL
jgi:hypothetical protein